MHYKLSICIPTYNRAKFLPDLLNSILREVDINNPVEICISDNASSDNTKDLIEEYRKRYPHIVYFCWSENMGFDRNLLKAVELARGEYCWLMGSDDIVESGSILCILNKLDGYKNLTGMSVNIAAYDFLCKKLIYSEPVVRGKLKNDTLFESDLEAYFVLFPWLGYLSGQIVEKKLWDSVVSFCDLSQFYNCYVHVFIIGKMLQNKAKWLYVSQKCVGWRSGNDSFLQTSDYLNRLKIDVVGYEKIIRSFFAKKSDNYKKLLSKIIIVHIKYPILGAKLNNAKNFLWSATKLMFSYYWYLPVFWLYIVPLLFTPRALLLMVRYLYRISLKRHRIKKL
jgi:abequosyltransferase